MADAQPNPFDKLQSWFISPGFQFGAGMMNAGQQGVGLGGAFTAGAGAATKAQQDQLQIQSAQRAMDQQKQRDSFFSNLDPNDPAYKGMPEGLMKLAKGVGSEQALPLLSQAYKSKMDIDAQVKMAQATGNVQLAMGLQKIAAEKSMQLQMQAMKQVQILRMEGAEVPPDLLAMASGQSGTNVSPTIPQVNRQPAPMAAPGGSPMSTQQPQATPGVRRWTPQGFAQ